MECEHKDSGLKEKIKWKNEAEKMNAVINGIKRHATNIEMMISKGSVQCTIEIN